MEEVLKTLRTPNASAEEVLAAKQAFRKLPDSEEEQVQAEFPGVDFWSEEEAN